MPEVRLRRHDLVWLDPGIPLASLTVTEAQRGVLRAWIESRLPLVVGRQSDHPAGLRLGFTLPGTGPRRRVEVHVPGAAIVAHSAPPPLDTVLACAPEAWQPSLQAVATAFRRVGLVPRAYGSLVTQAYTGEACLRPGSDVDLLIDCRSHIEADAALAILEAFGDGAPRLDGELRMADGWAVAWRELAHCAVSDGEMLAKSDDDVRLVSLDEFFAPLTTLGAAHGNTDRALAARAIRA